MIFRRKKQIEKQAKNFDKLITGLIIWGAVASMVGLSKTNRGQKIKENLSQETTKAAKQGYKIFGKVLVGVLSIFNKKK